MQLAFPEQLCPEWLHGLKQQEEDADSGIASQGYVLLPAHLKPALLGTRDQDTLIYSLKQCTLTEISKMLRLAVLCEQSWSNTAPSWECTRKRLLVGIYFAAISLSLSEAVLVDKIDFMCYSNQPPWRLLKRVVHALI